MTHLDIALLHKHVPLDVILKAPNLRTLNELFSVLKQPREFRGYGLTHEFTAADATDVKAALQN